MLRRTLMTLLTAGVLIGPAPAQAGTVGVPAASEIPSRNCSSPCTGRYTINAPSAGAEFTVDPVSGRQFSNGEAGWVDLPSGFDEWEYTGRAQGYRVVLDFPGSNTRQEWGIVVCRPAAPSENRVCAGNAPDQQQRAPGRQQRRADPADEVVAEVLDLDGVEAARRGGVLHQARLERLEHVDDALGVGRQRLAEQQRADAAQQRQDARGERDVGGAGPLRRFGGDLLGGHLGHQRLSWAVRPALVPPRGGSAPPGAGGR